MKGAAVGEYQGYTGNRAVLLCVLLMLSALSYLDRQIITLLVDPIKADLGVSDTQISFVQGLGYVMFYVVAGIPLGFLVDRYSRRMIILGGMLLWSLATMLCGLADTYRELLFARFMVGAGDAALLPAAYSLISDSFERGRLSTAMASFSLGAIVGAALSLAIGGVLVGFTGHLTEALLPLIGHVEQWQAVFLVVGLGGLPFALLIFLIREPARRVTAGAKADGSDRMMPMLRKHWRFFLLHFLAFSVMAMPGAANAAWAPAFLQRQFGMSIEMVGIVLGAKHLVAGTVGMIGSSMLADWLFRKGYNDAHLRIYAIGFPVAAALGVVAYTTSSVYVSLAAMALLGVATPFIAVAAAALQLGTASQHRGKVSALFLAVFNLLGFGVGPIVAAQLSDRMFGPEGNIGAAMAWTFALSAPLAVLLFVAAFRPMRVAIADQDGVKRALPAGERDDGQ